MQFAIHKLGFMPDNIVLFGWSIGGYSSLLGATLYPEIRGLILDATFDDVLQLWFCHECLRVYRVSYASPFANI